MNGRGMKFPVTPETLLGNMRSAAWIASKDVPISIAEVVRQVRAIRRAITVSGYQLVPVDVLGSVEELLGVLEDVDSEPSAYTQERIDRVFRYLRTGR